MKITLAVVASADGRITGPKGEQPRLWASREDQEQFQKLIKENGVVIVGRNTYLAHRKQLKLTPNIRRIVMTTQPGKLKKDEVKGRLEFTSLSPLKLIRALEKGGYRRALLAGGPKLSAAFLKLKLVNEIHITIEPKLFGAGFPILDGNLSQCRLKLSSSKQLNAGGTQLLRYKVSY
ncbi:dihydrofolate reductase family protein [Candidatus Kaiserbacteria bacterium]|nr:dihydrofolate reductase family protein [Candidatus Kaiserbacteria bacterium]